MKNQNGNSMIVLIIVGVVVLSGIGFFAYTNMQSPTRMEDNTTMMKKETPITQDTQMMKEETVMEEKTMDDKAMQATAYTGKVLAGKSAPYLEFNQADFEKAQKDGKVIFLDFYASWCPVCRAEAPVIQDGFNNLTTDSVVGFRVNYKDPETDENETTLAKELKIPYQHTKVVLKDGKEVLRSLDAWDKETFTNEMNKVLGN